MKRGTGIKAAAIALLVALMVPLAACSTELSVQPEEHSASLTQSEESVLPDAEPLTEEELSALDVETLVKNTAMNMIDLTAISTLDQESFLMTDSRDPLATLDIRYKTEQIVNSEKKQMYTRDTWEDDPDILETYTVQENGETAVYDYFGAEFGWQKYGGGELSYVEGDFVDIMLEVDGETFAEMMNGTTDLTIAGQKEFNGRMVVIVEGKRDLLDVIWETLAYSEVECTWEYEYPDLDLEQLDTCYQGIAVPVTYYIDPQTEQLVQYRVQFASHVTQALRRYWDTYGEGGSCPYHVKTAESIQTIRAVNDAVPEVVVPEEVKQAAKDSFGDEKWEYILNE